MLTASKGDQVLEALFAALRWFFLIAAAWMYISYYDTPETRPYFIGLYGVGIFYMGATQYVLHSKRLSGKIYYFVTRAGVLFDLISLAALMQLTGAAGSPMFAIGFLIILHASVYWRLKGGLLTAVFIVLCYLGIIAAGGKMLPEHELPFTIMNIIYLLFIGVMGGLIVARERKHMSEKRLFEDMAKKDYLTGLWNHRTFQEQLKEHIEHNRPVAVVMADIDKFKTINDSYGHLAGDKVLTELAHMLEQSFQNALCTAYRYGGEEFAIILSTVDKDEITVQIEAFRKLLAQTAFSAEADDRQTSFEVTMSFGAAIRSGQSAAELVKEADHALYEAKRNGRNRMEWSVAAGTSRLLLGQA